MWEKKIFAERVRAFTEQLERTLYDAYVRIAEEREGRGLPQAVADEVNLISWPQSWPDAKHGFERAGRDQRLTVQTHVVKDETLGFVLVYHGGRFAARVDNPGQPFWSRVGERRLPGQSDQAAWQELGAAS